MDRIENERTTGRCLTRSNPAGLRRSRSVRASIRLLRWMPPALKHSVSADPQVEQHQKHRTISPSPTRLPILHPPHNLRKDLKDVKEFLSEHFGSHLNRENLKNHNDHDVKVKNNLKLFNVFSKENIPYEMLLPVPQNVAPKAAALLHIPMSGVKHADERVSVDPRGNETENDDDEDNEMDDIVDFCPPPVAIHPRFLKRSMSLKDETILLPSRTATIRRGSVWANTASSKESF